jgi:putative ABC transport system substrate-binding protein
VERRTFLVSMGGGLLIAPGVARAQAKAVRLGAVPAGAPRTSPHWQAFTRRLADLGYVEGRNLTIEFRNADGQPDRFPELMTELVRLGVDVLLPIGPESSLRAARAATADLPIVVVAVDYDPIVRGYVGSLARPGGNITGTFLRQPELTPKWIELLREVLPGIKRVALFWDAFSADQADEADTAANNAGLQFLRTEFRQPPTPSTPRCARRRGSRPAPCSDSRPRSSTASAPIWPRPRSAAGCRPWCRSRSRPRQAF